MSAPALLEVRALHVRYGDVEAVRGVSLRVEPGSVTAVVGANGAGKTTLLAALAGLLPAAAGGVAWEGRDVTGATPEEQVARGLALVPETRELFPGLDVEDHLLLGAWTARRRGRAEREARAAEVYALFPRLAERRRQLAATLSGGERQMLALGRALMARPRLLLLDEPSLGLAPRLVAEILATVAALRARGVAVLLVDQNARAALELADAAYVMETGAVVLHGAAREVAGDPRVMESYLGLARP